MNGIAARHLAETGFPVFPCARRGKVPLTNHGFKDATTDLEQVTLWWIKHPDANIGFPTGTTGVVVLDVDECGQDSLRDLERDATTLPETLTVQTGGGGKHFYYRRPGGGLRNSAGRLGKGLDIRGEGGFALLPPSKTKDLYRTLNTSEIAPFPGWLYELLRDPKPKVQGSAGPVDMETIGCPIYSGTRNTMLASIAGSLRARGHDRTEIEQHLHEVNVSRCRPHLPLREVSKIAESISRYPAGKARPTTTPEVRDALDRVEASILSSRWPGIGGATDRAVLVALIALSKSYGILIPAGVRVSLAQRDLAMLTGTSRKTVQNSLQRLRHAGFVSRDNATRKPGQAGRFVLRNPQGVPTQPHGQASGSSGVELGECLPALRWGKGRLGKRAGEVLAALVAVGREATLHELVDMTGVRRDHLRSRYLRRLSEAGIIAVEGETVSLLPNWREALNREREITGELDSERADRLRYEKEREFFHQDLLIKQRKERNADKAS